jgi:hypothetical protein
MFSFPLTFETSSESAFSVDDVWRALAARGIEFTSERYGRDLHVYIAGASVEVLLTEHEGVVAQAWIFSALGSEADAWAIVEEVLNDLNARVVKNACTIKLASDSLSTQNSAFRT